MVNEEMDKEKGTENKELTIKEFEELWNKSAQFDNFFKYVIKHTTVVDRCGTEIMAKEYYMEVDDNGEVIVVLHNENGYIAFIKLKNIVDVY